MNPPHDAKYSEHLTTTGNTTRESKEQWEEEIRHDTKITKGETTTNMTHKSNDSYSTECSWPAQQRRQ
jgi:hypothetical protein